MPTARVLLVEDEPGLQLALTDRLVAEGYRVEIAEDGITAVRRATGEPFDVILLDVMLPGRDGFDVARTVRQQGVKLDMARQACYSIFQHLASLNFEGGLMVGFAIMPFDYFFTQQHRGQTSFLQHKSCKKEV